MFHLFSRSGALRKIFMKSAMAGSHVHAGTPQAKAPRSRKQKHRPKSANLEFQTLEPRLLLSALAIEPPPVTGNIADAADADTYVFTLDTPKTLAFDPLVYNGFRWSVADDAGQSVQSGTFYGNNVLNLGRGSYTLSVEGDAGVTGDYSFRLLDLAQHAASVQPDETVDFNFSSSTESKAFQFSAVAGERFYVDALTASISGDWQLIDPTGSVI